MLVEITRQFQFDAAHRVWGHESRCKHLHGHRYVVHVTVTAPTLDKLDRVVDFGVVKSSIGGHLDEFYDHNILLNTKDPLYVVYATGWNAPEWVSEVFQGKPPVAFENCNPTAEVIAVKMLAAFQTILNGVDAGLTVIRVTVNETPNCSATAHA